MIHDVGWMLSYSERETAPHSRKYLLRAIHEHMQYIVQTLKEIVDIELVSDMYFEYKPLPVPRGKFPGEYESEQLIFCRVLRAKEIEKRESQKWIKKTFEEMEISVEDFVKIFADVKGNCRKCAVVLKERGIKGLGEIRVAKIVNKLRNEFSETFLKNYPEEMMNLESKVVSISIKREK
jgi:hypothetical protein